MSSLKACTYEYWLEFINWIFLKNFNLAKILLLSLEEIGEGILEISACFSLSYIDFGVGINILLNWANIYYLKVLSLSLAISLFQPDSYMAEMNSQAAKPNSVILLKYTLCLLTSSFLSHHHFLLILHFICCHFTPLLFSL